MEHANEGWRARLEQAEADRVELIQKCEAAEQALRVKTKMLDDQNETIKTIKQTLNNKVSMYS